MLGVGILNGVIVKDGSINKNELSEYLQSFLPKKVTGDVSTEGGIISIDIDSIRVSLTYANSNDVNITIQTLIVDDVRSGDGQSVITSANGIITTSHGIDVSITNAPHVLATISNDNDSRGYVFINGFSGNSYEIIAYSFANATRATLIIKKVS